MVLVIIGVIAGLLVLAAVVRLIWSASHGDAEIEATSMGRQMTDTKESDRDTE